MFFCFRFSSALIRAPLESCADHAMLGEIRIRLDSAYARGLGDLPMRIPTIPHVMAALFLLLPYAASAQEDPEAVFGKFHRAMLTGNIDEMNKYGTPGGGTEIAKMPAEQRKQVLDMLKGLTPKRYKVTGRQPGSDGNSLTLRMTGSGASIYSA